MYVHTITEICFPPYGGIVYCSSAACPVCPEKLGRMRDGCGVSYGERRASDLSLFVLPLATEFELRCPRRCVGAHVEVSTPQPTVSARSRVKAPIVFTDP